MFNPYPFDFTKPNGINIMVMQSAEYRDRLIPAFKKYVDMGYNPNDVIERVFRELHINEEDLLDEDVNIINETIANYYKYH